MKIFIGMQNTGSLMADYGTGFRELGHEVFCVTETSNTIVSDAVDLNIAAAAAARYPGLQADDPKRTAYVELLRRIAWQKALEADVCMFIWNSFREDASDLLELKKLGKKIVVRFCDSEVREPEVEEQAGKQDEMPTSTGYLVRDNYSLHKRLHYLRMAELHADLLIGIARMGLRPSMVSGGWLYAPQQNPLPHPPQRHNPVILHAPSKWASKGTDTLLEILDDLRSLEVKFGFKMVQGIPHEEMAKEFASADIFCNSMQYSGRSVSEALAAGCVVADYGVEHARKLFDRYAATTMRLLGFSGSDEELRDRWWQHNDIDGFLTLPTVTLREESAAETLAQLILEYPRRVRLAAEGPAYLAAQRSPARRCQQILDYLADPDADENKMRLFFYPFFSRDFVPEQDGQRLALYNEGNRMVRDCPWYRRFIHPVSRAGLEF